MEARLSDRGGARAERAPPGTREAWDRSEATLPATTRGATAGRNEPAVAPGVELVAAGRLLAEDLPHLVREELALLKLEARQAAIRVGIASGLGIGIALGVLFLCVGFALAISQALETVWAGPLVVGGALVFVGAVGIPALLRRPAPAKPPGA